MISGKDINFNDDTHVLTINGEKHEVGDPGEIDDLLERVSAIEEAVTERFNVTLASEIATPTAFDSDCFYNPLTKEVNIRIMIYSADALIPVNGATIFTVPEKYRPASTIQLGMASLVSADNWGSRVVQLERCFLNNNGVFALNNFVYGPKPTKLFYINVCYLVG